jgi:hypothetical protein
MKINLSKSITGILIVGSFFAIDSVQRAFAQVIQTAEKPGILSASASSLASVEIEVHATKEQLVIPFCREPGTDERILYCNQGLEHNLEHFDGDKWIRTNPGYPGEVFGVEEGAWKPAVIPPGGNATFQFRFSPDFYHIRKGEKLRLEVLAWASAESMTSNGKPVSRFVSPVFVCP